MIDHKETKTLDSRDFRQKSIGAICGLVAFGMLSISAHATIIDPSTSLDVSLDLPAPGFFERVEIQIGFGGYTNDYPVPGEGFDVTVFGDGNLALLELNDVGVGNYSYLSLPDIYDLDSSSLRVVIDDVAGSFEVHQVSFFELHPSGAYNRHLGNVGTNDPNFVVNTVIEPATTGLIGLGLLALGLVRRKR